MARFKSEYDPSSLLDDPESPEDYRVVPTRAQRRYPTPRKKNFPRSEAAGPRPWPVGIGSRTRVLTEGWLAQGTETLGARPRVARDDLAVRLQAAILGDPEIRKILAPKKYDPETGRKDPVILTEAQREKRHERVDDIVSRMTGYFWEDLEEDAKPHTVATSFFDQWEFLRYRAQTAIDVEWINGNWTPTTDEQKHAKWEAEINAWEEQNLRRLIEDAHAEALRENYERDLAELQPDTEDDEPKTRREYWAEYADRLASLLSDTIANHHPKENHHDA